MTGQTGDGDRLDEIEARAAVATDGPWDDAEMRRWPGRWDVWDQDGRKCIAEVLLERDAEFVAAAREDVPWLIQQLRDARAENERLERAHELMARQFRMMQAEKEHGWREADRQESRAEVAEAELAAERAKVQRVSEALTNRSAVRAEYVLKLLAGDDR